MSLVKLLALAALVCGIVAVVLILAVHNPKVALTFCAIGVACAGGAEVVR